MKTTLKIAALILATIAVTAALGWVYAINALQQWVDQYVAVSMLTPATKPMALTTIRAKGKAIAPKAITITIKESRPDYAAMTIRELKKLCKGTGVKGWDKLRKAELVAALSAIP